MRAKSNSTLVFLIGLLLTASFFAPYPVALGQDAAKDVPTQKVQESGDGQQRTGEGGNRGGPRAARSRADRKKALSDLLRRLDGQDRALARQAAQSLLNGVQNGKTENAQVEHRNLLKQILSPADLVSGESSWGSALSVVLELEAWISAHGLPFKGFADVVLPLLGLGPAEFRTAVVNVAIALIEHEKSIRENSRGSPSLRLLEERLFDEPLPTEAAFRDIAAVLWHGDQHACLGRLVSALALYSEGSEDDPEQDAHEKGLARACVGELRRRLSVDFPSVEAWSSWWEEVREQSIPWILSDYQRRSERKQVVHWRRLFDRFRETGDAERVLLALQDSLELVDSLEMRLAVVAELGSYARWVEDVPLSGGNQNEQKAALLGRGLELALGVCERESYPLESPEVIRASLLALQKYRSYIESAKVYDRRIEDVILRKLEQWNGATDEKEKAIYLEAIRTAGALRVKAAAPHVDGLLRGAGGARNHDLALLTTAVESLGRLVNGPGMSRSMAELLIELFHRHVEENDRNSRDFRRAVLVALGETMNNEPLRAILLAFYSEILSGRQDATLRVQTILGIGRLVQGGQDGALASLLTVFEHNERYAPEEVRAAVDCLSIYVEPKEAVILLFRFIASVDKPIQEYVRNKLVALLESGGVALVAFATEHLVDSWLESGDQVLLEELVALLSSVELQDVLDPKKQDLSEKNQLVRWFNVTMILLRVQDLLGREDTVDDLVTQFEEFLGKNDVLKETYSDGVSDFKHATLAFEKRVALVQKLGDNTIGHELIVGEFEAILRTELSVLGRLSELAWWGRVLGGVENGARQSALRERSLRMLSDEKKAGLWKDVPQGARARFLGRLKNASTLQRSQGDEKEDGDPDTSDPSSSADTPRGGGSTGSP